MSIDLARLAGGVLSVPEDAAPPVLFAADELARYCARLYGRAPARRRVRGAPGAWLGLTAGGEPPARLAPGVEYSVRQAGDGAFVAGASPRALLAGVYALLESAGCRWSPDGPDAEHVPAPGAAAHVVAELEGRPDFARRVYAADLATWHYSVPARLAERLPADVGFVDWMAKSGATGLLFIRHANDTQWVVPELVPELVRRGLAIEGGGHALVELLPRGLFEDHPEYFPLGAAGRSDYGNVCVSSRNALAVVRAGARAARAAIGAPDLHLWGLDLFGGGWCACAGCAGLTPSDQALLVSNAVADALGDDGRVFHLAYHDTIDPPAVVAPHPRVWAEFAPRERCYAHAIDDPACDTNPRYRAALEAHLACFEGRVDVFEYYGDAILFGGCAVPLTAVVERDLAYYRAAGVRGVSCLVFGGYSLWAYGVNVAAFARAAWGPAAADDVRREYCERRFGPAAAPMARYLAALERTMAAALSAGDLLLPPHAAAARLGAALAEAPALRRLLADAERSSSLPPVAGEARLLDYTLSALTAVRAWLAARADADVEAALAALFAAREHVHAAPRAMGGSWGAYDLEVTLHFFAEALRARRR